MAIAVPVAAFADPNSRAHAPALACPEVGTPEGGCRCSNCRQERSQFESSVAVVPAPALMLRRAGITLFRGSLEWQPFCMCDTSLVRRRPQGRTIRDATWLSRCGSGQGLTPSASARVLAKPSCLGRHMSEATYEHFDNNRERLFSQSVYDPCKSCQGNEVR